MLTISIGSWSTRSCRRPTATEETPGADNARVAAADGWGSDFEPDRLARLELRAWKAYYRRQPLRPPG